MDTISHGGQDGAVNIVELSRVPIEAALNEIMDVQTDDMCEDTETVRNGYRDRSLTTSAGAISLRIPKLRAGTYFPEQIVDHYSRTDKAVVAAVREMCVNGVSTRKVERVASTSGRFRGPNRPETPQHADVSPGRRSRQRTTPHRKPHRSPEPMAKSAFNSCETAQNPRGSAPAGEAVATVNADADATRSIAGARPQTRPRQPMRIPACTSAKYAQ